MGHNNGLITAPVSIADVAAVLGVQSGDVATLCMHERINPYSIIAPRFTMNPGLMPSGFSDHTSGPPDNIHGTVYESPKWNVWVPTVGGNLVMVSDIWLHNLTPWQIRRPTAESFKCLSHFAGYNDTVEPEPPIANYTLIAGLPITIELYAPPADLDILAKGGTVSISNILGGMYFGCSIYRQPKSTGSAFLGGVGPIGTFVNQKQIKTDGTATTVIVSTDIKAQNDYYYGIIPWVCNTPTLTVDSKVYLLKIAPSYVTYVDKLIGESTAGEALVYINRLIYTDGFNPWGSTNYNVVRFALAASANAAPTDVQGWITLKDFKITMRYVSNKTGQEAATPFEKVFTAADNINTRYPSDTMYISPGSSAEGFSESGERANIRDFKFDWPEDFGHILEMKGTCTWVEQNEEIPPKVGVEYDDLMS